MTDVKLLGETKKAGFVYTSDERCQKWEVSEPILPGTLPPILTVTAAVI